MSFTEGLNFVSNHGVDTHNTYTQAGTQLQGSGSARRPWRPALSFTAPPNFPHICCTQHLQGRVLAAGHTPYFCLLKLAFPNGQLNLALFAYYFPKESSVTINYCLYHNSIDLFFIHSPVSGKHNSYLASSHI